MVTLRAKDIVLCSVEWNVSVSSVVEYMVKLNIWGHWPIKYEYQYIWKDEWRCNFIHQYRRCCTSESSNSQSSNFFSGWWLDEQDTGHLNSFLNTIYMFLISFIWDWFLLLRRISLTCYLPWIFQLKICWATLRLLSKRKHRYVFIVDLIYLYYISNRNSDSDTRAVFLLTL